MNSTEILVEAQAHVTEASRQLAAYGALSQEVQAALDQCAHTLAAIERPVLQGEQAAAEGLAAAQSAIQGAYQTVPDKLARIHTALEQRLHQALCGVQTLVEAWDAASHARPDLAMEEAALHARLTHLHHTYATQRAEAEAQHQTHKQQLAEELAPLQAQITAAQQLRDQLTTLREG